MTLSRQEPTSEYKNKDYTSRLCPTICIVFNNEKFVKQNAAIQITNPHFAAWDGHTRGREPYKNYQSYEWEGTEYIYILLKKVKGEVVPVLN
jgi:hypothetical protein